MLDGFEASAGKPIDRPGSQRDGVDGVRVWIGRSLLVIGVIHLAMGVVFFGDVVPPVFREGLFNSVTQAAPAMRGLALWYFFFGLLTLVVGGLVDNIERLGAALPAFLPWCLLATAVAGCVLMPVSGFWLLLVPVTGMFVRAGESERARSRGCGQQPDLARGNRRTSASSGRRERYPDASV